MTLLTIATMNMLANSQAYGMTPFFSKSLMDTRLIPDKLLCVIRVYHQVWLKLLIYFRDAPLK